MRGEALGRGIVVEDPGVPHGGHRAALQEEEQDLGRVARGAKGDDDPEEGGEVLAGPADDAEDAETDGYLGQADADDVEDLRDDTPFDDQEHIFGREAIYVSPQARDDEFGLAAHSDDGSDLDDGQ